MRKVTILLLAAAFVTAPPAAAHGGKTFQKGFVSTVSAILPNVLGVSANVTGGDARLRVSNYSGKTVVILGYEGEPYLRLGKSSIWANTRSPAFYLNRYRRSRGLRTGQADAGAPPRWKQVGEGASYEWFDHRIHWNPTKPPAGVRQHPDRIQRIFTWRVPARVDGKAFAITGLLGYTPPPVEGSRLGWAMWGVGGGAVVAALLAVSLLGVRARGRSRGPSGSQLVTETEPASGSSGESRRSSRRS